MISLPKSWTTWVSSACLNVLLLPYAYSQELNCSVRVNADQVQLSDKRIFTDMETSFTQFLNARKWTSDTYKPEEKIKCNINITIDKMVSIGNYEATVQIQSARPIYNTNYESILMNFADREWQFEYTESQPMEFVETRFDSNLTSLLAYYAYIILGFDYDSFSELGGTAYFNKAMNIVTEAQPSNLNGWSPQQSNRNRYWLAQNLTGQALEEIRKGIYSYHRLALDTFLNDKQTAQEKILDVLNQLKLANDRNPSQILITAFMDAKANELINIYGDAPVNLKRQAHSLLVSIDPAKKNRFDKILQN